MKLWTIQPKEVLEIVERKGVFYNSKERSDNWADFKNAYLWMVEEMTKRNILAPENCDLPLWAWHTTDWHHDCPDFEYMNYSNNGNQVCLEVEVPDEEVLLSDYDTWHYVLNNMYFEDSKTEEEWEKFRAEFELLDSDSKRRVTIKSWQKVFNTRAEKTEWYSVGRNIQATFWKLKKDYIVKVINF